MSYLHGKASTYVTYSCRCSKCTAAHVEYQWACKQRRQPPPPGSSLHGLESTYVNYRCRCEACVCARAEACKRRRAK